MKRITAAATITAPVLFLVVNLIHPKEYTRDHEAQQLREIAENYQRWQIAHFLTLVVLLIFVVVVVGFAWILFRRLEALALVGGLLGLWGLVSLGAVLALDGFTWGALGQVTLWPSADQHTLELALRAVQQSHWNLQYYVGALSWIVGLLILSIGLIRQGLIPALWGWIFAVGVVLVGIEGGVQNNAYFIAAAAVLAVGGAGVGVALANDTDSTSSGQLQTG